MHKIMALMLVAATMAGCASSRPIRLTEGNYKGVPIVVVESSSDGLRLLRDSGAVTVRDMTKEEFSDHESDVAKYNELRSARPKPLSGDAYHASVGAVGLAVGLTFKYASGLALVGMLSSDSEGRNYSFSGDYHSQGFLMSASSEVSQDRVRHAAMQVLAEFAPVISGEYGVTPLGEVSTDKIDFPKGRIESVFPSGYGFERVSVKFSSDKKRASAVIVFGCHDAGSNCRITFNVRMNNEIMGLTNPMRERFMEILGDSYALYIAPNSSLFNLPSVLYGDGRLEYLVEK